MLTITMVKDLYDVVPRYLNIASNNATAPAIVRYFGKKSEKSSFVE